MAAIAAQLYGDTTPPMVVLSITGLVAGDVVDVWREPPNEPAGVVRGSGFTATSATAVLLDTAPELGRPLVYVVQVTAAGGVSQASAAPIVVPDPGRHVLSDPYTGASVLVDLIATPDDRTGDVPHSLLQVKGRAEPVPLYDVRGSDSGEVVFYARSRAEVLEVVDLLAEGGPLVSRHPYDGCDVAGSEVLFLPAVTRRRRSRAGDRTFTLPFHVVANPDPTRPAPLANLGALADYVPGTLADIADEWATLLDLALDPLA